MSYEIAALRTSDSTSFNPSGISVTVYDTLGSDSESGVTAPELDALWARADCAVDEPGESLFKEGIVAPGFVLDEHPMRSSGIISKMTLDLIAATQLCCMSCLPFVRVAGIICG